MFYDWLLINVFDLTFNGWNLQSAERRILNVYWRRVSELGEWEEDEDEDEDEEDEVLER